MQKYKKHDRMKTLKVYIDYGPRTNRHDLIYQTSMSMIFLLFLSGFSDHFFSISGLICCVTVHQVCLVIFEI